MNMSESYESVLSRLTYERPTLAQLLRSAEEHRAKTCATLLEGARFKGIEQLLVHLSLVEEAFARHPEFTQIRFLIARARGDFETAIEATISGYLSVAIDSMRDTIEIENLLLDFTIKPGRMTEWLNSDDAALKKRFKPVDVRRRLAQEGIGKIGAHAESVDYSAHSAALHVNPRIQPLAEKGFVANRGFDSDAGFWEVFEHARRLLIALDRIMEMPDDGSFDDVPNLEDLGDVKDAWERTQQMQTMFLALWQATAGLSDTIPGA
jgi:hypothetical protein